MSNPSLRTHSRPSVSRPTFVIKPAENKNSLPTTPAPTRADDSSLTQGEIARRNALNVYKKITGGRLCEKRSSQQAMQKGWGKNKHDWTVITFGMPSTTRARSALRTPSASNNKNYQRFYSKAETPKGTNNPLQIQVIKDCIQSVLKLRNSDIETTPSQSSDAFFKKKRRPKAERNAKKS